MGGFFDYNACYSYNPGKFSRCVQNVDAPYNGSYADVVFCVAHENDANLDCSSGSWLDPATEGVYYPTVQDCYTASTGAWCLCIEDKTPLNWNVYCEEKISQDEDCCKSGGSPAPGYYISQPECEVASIGVGDT